MGGRGSGGGRSGGGGGASSQQDHEVKLRSLNEIYQEKYSQMTDSELNRALTNAIVYFVPSYWLIICLSLINLSAFLGI